MVMAAHLLSKTLREELPGQGCKLLVWNDVQLSQVPQEGSALGQDLISLAELVEERQSDGLGLHQILVTVVCMNNS